VVAHRRLDTPNIYDETEETAYELARAADIPTADTVLISGTGLATAGIVDRLEKDLGKRVVTSQAATLWQALTLVQLDEPVKGYGQLLASVSTPR
jgi:maleate cis-trans isomerase